tara:strand:+ start:1589 stop:1894 length:306 start_codon:yes stop_codon:yes gene_type:complete
LNVLLNYPIINQVIILNYLSDRRKRLHDLLLTLINKESNFELIEEDSSDLKSIYSSNDTANLSRIIEKNRKIINKYQALVRSAVILDALMDSENEENYKIK